MFALRTAIVVLLLSLSSLVFAADPINLNAATAEELATLQGIGPKKAAAIIAYRTDNGPFQSVDELMEVSGIGPKLLESNRDAIAVELQQTAEVEQDPQ